MTQYLADSALAEILERAAPILGTSSLPRQNCWLFISPTYNWMSKIDDEKKLVDMNLPGIHDAATWDYSDARQAELSRIREAVFFRCQERSLLQSLNDGIRVFDLRLGYNPGTDTIGFYHAHPSETILVSINQKLAPIPPYDKKFEEILFATINEFGKKFWLPVSGELGTLGAARGKLVLLQRFTYQYLSSPANPFGIHLDAEADTFMPLVPPRSSADVNITSKFEAVTSHLAKAMNATLDSDVEEALYVSFASAHKNTDKSPRTYEHSPLFGPIPPTLNFLQIIALGDASTKGMNERLLPWFKQHKGNRFGIVLLDFYHSRPELVEAIIGL
ncbi:PLC-like phosphodiesterase [Mycena olivaceomarginata]|nr:PLC-like phosphodiesterase [Mycena olivaceomarginata]